jgi:uncharacterized protein (DUF433 family)
MMVDQAPETVDLRKYIDHYFFSGYRPHVRGRRLPVADVVAYAQGTSASVVELAYAFSISEAEALAALLYYEENQAEIDAYEQAAANVTPEDWTQYGDQAPLLRRNDAASGSE